MKAAADDRRGARAHDFKVGEFVLFKQKKINKASTRFEREPFKIIEVKGDMIVGQNSRRTLCRNCACFKRFISIPESCQVVKLRSCNKAKANDENLREGEEDTLVSFQEDTSVSFPDTSFEEEFARLATIQVDMDDPEPVVEVDVVDTNGSKEPRPTVRASQRTNKFVDGFTGYKEGRTNRKRSPNSKERKRAKQRTKSREITMV